MSTFEVKVCKITSVKNHPNADKLDVCRVQNFEWDVITGRDQYKVNDLVVYVPMDAVLPESIIKTLNQKISLGNGRIRAAKIRGLVSYGMFLPVDKNMKLGDDVAEKLGIKKYEQPATGRYLTRNGNIVSKKKLNPLFDKYTDIEHLKRHPNSFIREDGSPDEVVVSEKIHGSNIRMSYLPRPGSKWYHKIRNLFIGDYEYCVGSRQVQQKLDGTTGKTWLETQGKTSVNVYVEIFNRLNCRKWLPKDTIVYGEVYGKGIQDLEYGLNDIAFICFDVKVKGRYLNYDELKAFCIEHNLSMVHEFYRGPWKQDCLEYRNGLNIAGITNTHIREGVVVRPVKERHDDSLGRVILKVISEDYLTRSNDDATEFQ